VGKTKIILSVQIDGIFCNLGKFRIYRGYVAHIPPNKQKARSVYIADVTSFQ